MVEYPYIWQEFAEIALIALPIYVLSVWLRKDKHIPLLRYAYWYGAGAFGAYILNFHVILTLLPVITPFFFLCALILHQDLLQKNIITHKHVSYPQNVEPNWLEHLLSSCLTHINTSKSVTILLEHMDDISPFVTAPFILKVAPHKDLFNTFLNPHIHDGQSMLWIQSSGSIMSPSTLWKNQQDMPFDAEINQEIALLYTRKTDALLCIVNQQKRTCSLIVHGNIIPNITTYQAHHLMQKHIYTNLGSHTTNRKGMHEPPTTTPQL